MKTLFTLGLVIASASIAGGIAVLAGDHMPLNQSQDGFINSRPENAEPVLISGHAARGWVVPDPTVTDPFLATSQTESNRISQQENASRGSSAKAQSVSRRTTKPVTSSIHQDLDRKFTKQPPHQRTEWKRKRQEYDLDTARYQHRGYRGTFPGRS